MGILSEQQPPVQSAALVIGGAESVQKDVWLLQDEMTFKAQEFTTIDLAIDWIGENMDGITDVL